MNTPLTVSQLNIQINGLLETTFSSVYLQGEISNLTYHSSGHIYFSVKDNKSSISCVMFKGNAQYLKFTLEVGAKIIISGNITVYAPRGTYQLICKKIEPSGVGALALAYEQLKTKLQIKGYFNTAIKKQLPIYPQIIYVVTSNTGAAIEDMKKILNHRYPLAKMVLLPTLVQGIGAKEDIVKNINLANKLFLKDTSIKSLLIVGRGGGSIEDLWAFNEEIVADSIYNANIPVISAVGHENDFVISDFVADIRASTPSNAIELSTPNINELRQMLDIKKDEFNNRYKTIINNKELELKHLSKSFAQHSLKNRFLFIETQINQLKYNFQQIFGNIIKHKENQINVLNNNFLIHDPQKKSKIGFVQVTKNNKLMDINHSNIGDIITLESIQTKFKCEILDKQKITFD